MTQLFINSDFDSFSNEYSTFYVLFIYQIIFFVICNFGLNVFMSCIKQCVNTYIPLQMKLLCFLCIAKINFVDTDLICLATVQMSYYSK